MNGIGRVEPKAEVLFHQRLENEAQVLFKTQDQGVVIKGKIAYSALPVPVQDFIGNLMRIPSDELGVQETARTVFATVRAPSRCEEWNVIRSVEQVEGGDGKLVWRWDLVPFNAEVTKVIEKSHHGVK